MKQKYVSVFYGICICLSAITTGSAQGQNDPDSLFRSGNWEKAELWYAYREFRAGDALLRAEARIGRASCLKLSGDFSEAAILLDQTPLFGLPDSLRSEIISQSVLNHYLAGEPATAISRALQTGQLWKGGHRETLVLLTLAMSYLDEYQLDDALSTGTDLLISLHSTDSLMDAWQALLEPSNRPDLKNPRKARILSMIIPGSGQIYAGNTGSGLFNTAIHGVLLTGVVLAAVNGYWVSAWLAGMGLFQKFYYGGIQRAEELAEIKNRQVKKDFILPVKKFLLDQMNYI